MEADLSKGFRVLSIILLFVFLIGCASKSSIQREPLHAGKEKRFQADFDKTLEVAHEAMIVSGLQIESNIKIDDKT
jgi:PBP1b-binding outer membrane lipoprotein LpoB